MILSIHSEFHTNDHTNDETYTTNLYTHTYTIYFIQLYLCMGKAKPNEREMGSKQSRVHCKAR